MNTHFPAFPQTPEILPAVATAACNPVDGAGAVFLCKGKEDGTMLVGLGAMARGTVSAAGLLLFLSKDNGTTKQLIDAAFYGGFNLSTTATIPRAQFTRFSESTPFRLGKDQELYVGSMVALPAGFVFEAEAVHF
ncbi:hypothetical protein IP91_00130 [Pseudoduganella lurida]|uniref:Uncharacterized protein n=1 Tax=Pseudoduganella lurida TaxID=1036180 RepID=A0A562RJ16_9BURK|nr:hypothetical protein [Pseudoduganella lurida]TWI69065.1 hypothetical protein IP91_00130 [Pseudoduganella lurida]